MILTPSGQVLTNNHLIRDATQITATMPGRGTTYQATVVGADSTADVALLQLHGVSGLPTVPLADPATTTVGQPIVAIGNAHGLGGTPVATKGTVSAEDQTVNVLTDTGPSEHLTGLLQVTASVTPGCSGGPLVDGAGQVVGMDTAAVLPQGSQTSTTGYAIPLARAEQVVTSLRAGASGS
ncbi:MAG TPA: trypsin-like peptidase domain-containing protein [Acidimicrobiales bacterium]|nr:trypsin-like peptidase domain-containing protein [Acidimicrobiales bacterium]